MLQAAFRGHLTRAKLLSSTASGSESPSMPCLSNQNSPSPRVPSPLHQAKGDPEQEEAITIIQSTLRAHLARTGHNVSPSVASGGISTATSTKRRPVSATREGTSSPYFSATASGKEGREESSWKTPGEPAPEEEAPRPWGPGNSSTLQPFPVASSPSRPPADDVSSDDSDEIVMAPALPLKKSTSPP